MKEKITKADIGLDYLPASTREGSVDYLPASTREGSVIPMMQQGLCQCGCARITWLNGDSICWRCEQILRSYKKE